MQATITSPVFTLTAQATYELVLPVTTDAIKVTAWLESKGASFDRYFRSNGTVKFVFIAIPETLVCQIASKYSLVDLTPLSLTIPDTIPEFETVIPEYPSQKSDSDRPESLTPEPVETPYFFADIYTDKEIKARYRQLSKIHHPDAGGNPEMFQALHSQYLAAIEPW